ncbi:MAG: ABC-type transport auxiliary lipoprotein family protein [Alphaproteobacteria bacterium]
MMHLRLAAAAFAALVLSGCVGALPGSGTPPKLYDLSPKSTFDPNLPKVPWQIIVQEPVAAASIDTNRVAVRQSALSVEYFKGVAWVDRAPRLVQTLIIESFENTGKILSVGREAVGLRADYLVKTELREFEADYTKGARPVAVVRMNVKLVRMPERSIVANETFSMEVEAGGTAIEPIMVAFDDALGKVLKRTVEWTLRAAAALPRPSNPASGG